MAAIVFFFKLQLLLNLTSLTSTEEVGENFFEHIKDGRDEATGSYSKKKKNSSSLLKQRSAYLLRNYSANQGNHTSFKFITNPYFASQFI